VPAAVAEWLRLLEACERLSREMGIPHIGWDDGAALYALAFAVAAERGEVVAVDAGAGAGFSTLWVLAALESAGAGGRLVAVEALERRVEERARPPHFKPVPSRRAEGAPPVQRILPIRD